MAVKGNKRLHDPVGNIAQVGVMESGVMHCADSLIGGREGTAVIHQGAPGDPMEKSAGVKSGYMGKTPNISHKFYKGGQR